MLSNVQPPSFMRVLAAIVYDLLILFLGIYMITGFVLVSIYQMTTGQDAIPASESWLPLFLQLVALSYYVFSWKRGGQTIGMKAWRIYLVPDHHQKLIFQELIIRFFIAQVSAIAFGAGYLMRFFHPQKRFLHDLLSHTHLVYRPKSVNSGKKP